MSSSNHPNSAVDPSSLFSVSGLVAVVTGGGTGIGLMIATTLESNGATVYIVGRRLEVLQNAAKEHSKYGNIIPIQGDVTSRSSLLSVVSQIKSDKGYINLLINNSGVMYNKPTPSSPDGAREKQDIKAFQEMLWNAGTPEEFNKALEVNVASVYYTSVAFLELLDAGNRRSESSPGPSSTGDQFQATSVTSQIVTISSIGGFRRDPGAAAMSVSYGPSKAAATHLGKTLANYLAPWKIRSNVIAPGIYPSEMTEGVLMRSSEAHVPATVVPMQRYGNIEDIGGLILFLASRAGAYVNGAVHLSDGGRLGLFSSTY